MINAEAIDKVKGIIVQLLEQMGFAAEIETREQAEALVFNIRTAEPYILIGQRGVNLAALQYLCRILAHKALGETVNFVVDVDNYKRKREAYLAALAEQARKEVLNNRATIVFRPMSAYERRVLHTALADYTDIRSGSVGQEPNRSLVICPADTALPETLPAVSREKEYTII